MSEWDDVRSRLDDFLRVRGGTIPAQAEADIRSALGEIERLTAGYHRRGNELDEQYQEILTRGKRAEAAAAKLAEAETQINALRLACNVSAADLIEAGRICGQTDDEYPLKAVQRMEAEVERQRERAIRQHGRAEVAEAEVKRLRVAATALMEKMDRLESTPEYQAVWSLAMIHGQPYQGENWKAERDALRAALRGGEVANDGCDPYNAGTGGPMDRALRGGGE